MAILDADKRIINHGKITLSKIGRTKALKGHEANVPSPTMRQVCEVLRSALGLGVERDDGKVEIKFKDISFTNCNGYATLLFNVVNKRGASAVVRDTQDDSTEELPLVRPSQGYEASCHFVINLTPEQETGQYKFSFEIVPKLGIQRIESLLKRMLLKVSEEHFELYYVDQNYVIATEQTLKKNIMKFNSTFEITLTPDEEFMDELHNGVISNVKLIKYDRSIINFADRTGVIHAKRYSLEIESSRDNGDCISWLRSVAASELGQEYDQISFSFKQETGQRSAKLELSNIQADGLEKILIKKSILENFNHPLKDSYDHTHEPIESKIIEAM